MNITRVHDLIRYILAEASQDDEWTFRELGPIHIIKYVYLADMYFAMGTNGETFTGINWQFYHLGPWDLGLYKEIPNAAMIIGAKTRTFESRYAKDGVRFSLKDEHYDDSSSNIPLIISARLQKDIHDYGSATNDLLHYVYTTPPMANAAPREYLDFSHVVYLQKPSVKIKNGSHKLTPRFKKKRKKRILDIREKIAKKSEEKRKKRIKPTPPRYDEIFFQGTNALENDIKHTPIKNHKGVLRVNPDAWSGNWRRRRDLP